MDNQSQTGRGRQVLSGVREKAKSGGKLLKGGMDSLPTLPPLLGSKCPAFEAFPSKFEPFLPGGSTLLDNI